MNVRTREVTDPTGVVTAIHFTTPDGRIANAFGTAVRFQTLEQWQAYVSLLWSYASIRDAWRLLLTSDQAHDFRGSDFETARRVLVAKNNDLEMIYKEK